MAGIPGLQKEEITLQKMGCRIIDYTVYMYVSSGDTVLVSIIKHSNKNSFTHA